MFQHIATCITDLPAVALVKERRLVNGCTVVSVSNLVLELTIMGA